MVFLSFLAGVLGAAGVAGAYFRYLSPYLGFYLCLGAVIVIALNLPLNLARFITRGKRFVSPGGLLFGLIATAVLGALLKFTIENPVTDITNSPANPPAFHSFAFEIPATPEAKAFLDPSFALTRNYDPSMAEKQARAYPNIYTLELPIPPSQAIALAGSVVAKHPEWRKTYEDAASFTIEIEEEMPLFHSIDDFVIQAAPAPAGSHLLFRSRSRFGFTDFGFNAKRVQLFSSELVAAGNAMMPPMKVEFRK